MSPTANRATAQCWHTTPDLLHTRARILIVANVCFTCAAVESCEHKAPPCHPLSACRRCSPPRAPRTPRANAHASCTLRRHSMRAFKPFAIHANTRNSTPGITALRHAANEAMPALLLLHLHARPMRCHALGNSSSALPRAVLRMPHLPALAQPRAATNAKQAHVQHY